VVKLKVIPALNLLASKFDVDDSGGRGGRKRNATAGDEFR
jgi:hypothetical protein